MQRQSLGSPSPKVPKLEALLSDEDDAPKPNRLSSPPPSPHKFVHFIPVLTLLCFFILYLFSHAPSPSDLNHFSGFNRSPSHRLDLPDKIGGDIGHYMDVKRSEVLAIRTLQQIPKSRSHRKLADF
ncbi:hypothetical protein PHAVU_002G138000 [Phaseolus vulgaris]|uniref:Uncharacterized protein n=1 Tax=Phaseolus vulgaris TaxID=3885 RepID=V7CLX5_PHAVU|nr:hypothetical protein PHAVU_002G138000g [Phaseolus vulgaris]ESW30260.1 hypothetical protein PHAVU_002G138000g [Phaseolus vulgaris]